MSEASSESTGWVTREVEAMQSAWRRGRQATAHDAIARRPGLESESAIRLIYEEACLRREAGQDVTTADVIGRHPRWAGELRALFECDRLIRSPRGSTEFPEAGDTLGPFLLLAELGRGAAGRTFLASDPALADRPVVVKVIPDDQDEHLALARLRHTHIVPLFSEHTFADRGLRGLCMPYLGGTSLSQILDDLTDVPIERRTGKLLVKVIDRHSRSTPALPPADGPFRRSLEQARYVQAMTWIAACLADALHYAHARGLVHLDIKPSNVLITMDGQPMLLDFHLARGSMVAGEVVADRLGGTPGWMSPEQESAMAAVASGCPLPSAVDGRSDVYSLGLMLRGALGLHGLLGDHPGARPIARQRGVASVGLTDILRKCLAADPRDRYDDPLLMAEDLRRELNDLPLRGVRNRSLRERCQKWRRRHPGRLAWGAVGLLALVVAGVASTATVVAYQQILGHVLASLEDGRRNRAAGRYGEAVRSLERGLETAATYPLPDALRKDLSRELHLAGRSRLGEELHALADRVRFRYGIDLPAQAEGKTLLRLCGTVWANRNTLLGEGPQLDREAERRIRTDLVELAAIRADLLVHLAPSDEAPSARRESLRILGEAERTCGPSFALEARRERISGPVERRTDAEEDLAPPSAWEHYERGRYHLRAGRLEEAAEHFRRTLESRPQDFWPNFYHGLCSFRLGRFEDAAADFRACIVLDPDAAICHYNRALAFEALGRIDEASRGYTRAIELDPGLAAARLNRGILFYKGGRHPEATIDFRAGLDSNPERQLAGRLHFNLALAQLAQDDRPSARANAEKAVELGCQEAVPLSDELR